MGTDQNNPARSSVGNNALDLNCSFSPSVQSLFLSRFGHWNSFCVFWSLFGVYSRRPKRLHAEQYVPRETEKWCNIGIRDAMARVHADTHACTHHLSVMLSPLELWCVTWDPIPCRAAADHSRAILTHQKSTSGCQWWIQTHFNISSTLAKKPK